MGGVRTSRTHFEWISLISHTGRGLDQVWKLIQKTDVEILSGPVHTRRSKSTGLACECVEYENSMQ